MKEIQWTLDRAIADSTALENFDLQKWIEYNMKLDSTEWFVSIDDLDNKLNKKEKIISRYFKKFIQIIDKIFELENKLFLQMDNKKSYKLRANSYEEIEEFFEKYN